MALTWDVTKCNLDKQWQVDNWPTIEALIFLTMSIQIGKITTENLEEVEYRLRMVEKTVDLQVKDVLLILPQLVGLYTNVITENRATFHKKVISNLEYDVNYLMRMAKRSKEENESN